MHSLCRTLGLTVVYNPEALKYQIDIQGPGLRHTKYCRSHTKKKNNSNLGNDWKEREYFVLQINPLLHIKLTSET